MLARGGAARVALPGGDIIGARPVDLHLEALTKMGADIQVKHGVVYATASSGLKPADISLRFASVGATHQVLLAASLTPGMTILRGAAREPEVVALANMLNSMGAKINGAGDSIIEIQGQESLGGCAVELIGDRIEAATYVLATAITGGEVLVNGFDPKFFGSFLDILDQMQVGVEIRNDGVKISAPNKMRGVKVTTAPFPGFATDIQAPLMAALTLAEGNSEIEEMIFEGRFAHVGELCRMGADITIDGRKAIIRGVKELSGAPVEGNDIRAAAALVIAALAADGFSQIHEPQHIRRGYSQIEDKLRALGARIGLRQKDPEDFLLMGC
jgi:UDP-N-acetylglucosamine 1-carboxyvinyltransferase